LVDSDDDCPAELGPELLSRAVATRSDMPISVVLAKREYEAWFIAAAESLRGWRGLPEDLEAPRAPEDIRGAKEWLKKRLRKVGRTYTETADQQALTWAFALDAAIHGSPSFKRCYQEILRLLNELQTQGTLFLST
jgi:hypothetical protein